MATVHFNKESFQNEVLNKKGLALVDFWATWCGPCRMLGPVIDELAGELEGSVLVGKVNVDEEEELARQYRVIFSKMGNLLTVLLALFRKKKFWRR